MSAPNNITRIVLCIRCERPYWNTGPAICGGCEDTDQESSLGVPKAKAPRRACISIHSTVQGDCAGCGKFTRIDLRDVHCVDCQRKRYQRNRMEVFKQKVRCEGCFQIKRREYLTENICRRCALIRKNDVAFCIQCGKEKLIAVKKNGPLCLSCYQDRDAARRLRKLLNDYYGPNQNYLTQLTERIDWSAVDEDIRRRFSTFLAFLESVLIPDPLTWEWLNENMPSLSGEKGKRSQAIRSCLWELAYIQFAEGRLGDRKSYLEWKRIENLVEQVPDESREEISDHVDWMKAKGFAPNTIYTRLLNTRQLLTWCHHREVGLHDMTNFLFEEFEQYYRWQWICTDCDAELAYDIYGNIPCCPDCGEAMVKTRWHTNPTVGIACDHIKGLLDWVFKPGLTQDKIEATARHDLTFRHYSTDVIKQIAEHVASKIAHPIEGIVFYLILFHTCSVWELIHAQLPTDENGKVRSLSDALCITIPEREPSRGNLSTGRVEKRIDFDPVLLEFLPPLFSRVDAWRTDVLKGLNNKYLLITSCGAKHQKPVASKFIANTIDRGCANAGVGHCTAKTLRLTAAAMFADAGVIGILELMGWSKQRAYQLGLVENREAISPGVRRRSKRKNNTRQPPAGALAK